MIDIMLVDDEVLALEYLKNMVDWERNGYHVVGCATSGKKALELFDRTHPQIVISDIRMPGTDGLELTRQIKEKDKETVVILLSAYRDFDYAQKGIRYGVANYLLKHELSAELILKELEEVKEKLERAFRATASFFCFSTNVIRSFRVSLPRQGGPKKSRRLCGTFWKRAWKILCFMRQMCRSRRITGFYFTALKIQRANTW